MIRSHFTALLVAIALLDPARPCEAQPRYRVAFVVSFKLDSVDVDHDPASVMRWLRGLPELRTSDTLIMRDERQTLDKQCRAAKRSARWCDIVVFENTTFNERRALIELDFQEWGPTEMGEHVKRPRPQAFCGKPVYTAQWLECRKNNSSSIAKAFLDRAKLKPTPVTS